MKGGVILFRGTGAAARRYLESDRSTADEYYLEGGTALAELAVSGHDGEVIETRTLDPEGYSAWVDWIDPITGTTMGTPRVASDRSKESPRFAEMVINASKSLSIAAALHPEVSDALDAAQQDAASEIRRWLAEHSVTRVGSRNAREIVPVQQLQTVTVAHKTSRAGDPHRHIHFQIGTRVYAAGKWRALDTAALFKQQGTIRALGTAIIAAHPQLASVLDQHGLTLDSATGEVAELEPFNVVMSKRGAQVERNLARFEAEWETGHPGEEPGPVVRARLKAKAWEHERPGKKPAVLGSEAGWRAELEDAGYTQNLPRARCTAPVALDELHIEEIASRALDRCAAGASAWTVHTVREHVTRITTEYGVQAAPRELRDFVQLATQLAAENCFSVLPPDTPTPEHVAHLTSLRVVAAETELRDLLTARAEQSRHRMPDVHDLAVRAGLDDDQELAASTVASANPLVVIEGAAGSGKTTMLKTAIAAATAEGRSTRVVTPTKKAADVAAQELGIPTDSVAALVYAHGVRWNSDGVWTRLRPGDTDPETGRTYRGPVTEARLAKGERVVVDEAGMLDQDSALALLRIADEADATIALIGDRAQLPAVGRGGVLDFAARLTPAVVDMTSLHRFTDDAYAVLTLDLRRGHNPAAIFDQLNAIGLIELHESDDGMQEAIAKFACPEDAITAATNDEARALNERIRAERVERGEVDDVRTVFGNDELPIGAGDVIQTRRNESTLVVASRQTWTVQHVGDDGALSVVETVNGRRYQRTMTLPAEYVTKDAHLAYAVTAYGVQGTTVNASHTVLTDALDAAGIYVGMTRGRETNTLHVVATDCDDAKQQFVDALVRDRADRGLGDATERAREAVANLVEDGPMSIVNAERDRIVEQIAQADAERGHWVSAAARLRDQSERHQAEYQPLRELAEAADAKVAALLADVTESLAQEAATDGSEFLAAQRAAYTAHRAKANALRFRRRAATRTAKDADTRREAVERNVHSRWQSIPHSESGLPAWAEAVARRQADHAPAIIEARAEAAQAHQLVGAIAERQSREHTALYERVLGRRRPSALAARIKNLRERVTRDRRYLAQLDALPPDEAVRLIHERAAQAEAQRLAAEEARGAAEALAKRLSAPGHERDRGRSPHRDGPSL
ncbi:MobF family relaxase [Microbacterium sp. ZXX196]|uniref:MobF family relaxase n=1 Tax=Microbacterium sp. ZXX196 TaxID=2609291 RepID=UPI0012B6B8D7|nr:MobF family relaxase [Microbacterium sp. ZXX196]MTE24735.1 AAA family ATPase [Microbacterium sp. ZXX196]